MPSDAKSIAQQERRIVRIEFMYTASSTDSCAKVVIRGHRSARVVKWCVNWKHDPKLKYAEQYDSYGQNV